MSPKVATPSAEWVAWAGAHRCPICNALPVSLANEAVKVERSAKSDYRQSAAFGVPLEDWQTDIVAIEYRTEIECENGHTLTGHHWKFTAEDA